MCRIKLDFLSLKHFLYPQNKQNLSFCVFLRLIFSLRQHFYLLGELVMFIASQKLGRALNAFNEFASVGFGTNLHFS